MSNRTSLKSIQVITMTRAIKLPCFVVIWWVVREWFSFYRADKQIFANRCHSRDFQSRSWKGHPVHFPRPIYSLCQISKVLLQRFWRERQKLRRRTRWKRTENKSHPRPGWLNQDNVLLFNRHGAIPETILAAINGTLSPFTIFNQTHLNCFFYSVIT